MTTPTPHSIDRPGGGELSVWTIGPAAGFPVVLCHPAPGSGRFDPDPKATAEAGIRIIAPDRQGYGGSSPTAAATIEQAGHDLVAALDSFGIPSAAVVGWSAGGRVAMWLAAHHPERVLSLTLAGTPAPHEAVPWIPDEQVAMIDGLRSDPAAAIDEMVALFGPMVADPALRASLIAPGRADSKSLEADQELAARVDTMLDEAFRQGPRGMAIDIASYTMAEWGFRAADIAVPAVVFSGAEDVVVPPPHGEWYAGQIARAGHTVEPGWGHLLIVGIWHRVLDNLDR